MYVWLISHILHILKVGVTLGGPFNGICYTPTFTPTTTTTTSDFTDIPSTAITPTPTAITTTNSTQRTSESTLLANQTTNAVIAETTLVHPQTGRLPTTIFEDPPKWTDPFISPPPALQEFNTTSVTQTSTLVLIQPHTTGIVENTITGLSPTVTSIHSSS